jgi:subtilisin family serine protease
VKFFALAALAALAMTAFAGAGVAADAQAQRYLVVFKDDSTLTGVTSLVPAYSAAEQQAAALVGQAGGTIASNMVQEIGVVAVESSNALFDETMRESPLVLAAAEELRWKAVPTAAELGGAATNGLCNPIVEPNDPDCPPTTLGEEAFEDLQWDMQQICAVESDDPRWSALCGTGAHALPGGKGRPQVDVGVLDTGIDGKPGTGHVDLQANVDCPRGRDSIGATQIVPTQPAVALPDPCIDNGFHGTHVAGTIAADDNGAGMVGIAPNVRLIPVKVCDSTGFCYSNAVIDGIYYSGHQKFDVINMSFFVDDDQFLQSHEFKCASDPVQRAIRHAVERAIQFARNQGVTPIAALGNSDEDLAHPSEPNENECDVVPAETQGVVGTMALGRDSQKAGYSNYGSGMTDVAAPGGSGGTGDCLRSILSTFPGNTYFCIQGTSMASPHSAGVAALIVSVFGEDSVDTNDSSTGLDDTAPPIDVRIPPQKVENYLQSTTIDLINALGPTATKTLTGYDECFGNGRIDARRAVLHETSTVREVVPVCADGQD